MKSLHERLTFANVVSVVALFVALGSGAYAVTIGRNDVGAPQIARNAVGTSELKNNKTKGKDVDESSLGQVPSAASADTADLLDGQDSGSFRVGCPPGFTQAAGVCFENNRREVTTFRSALEACGGAASRLPTVSELFAFASMPGIVLSPPAPGSADIEWTGNTFIDVNMFQAFGVLDNGTTDEDISNFPFSEQLGFRCVQPISN